TAPRMLLELMCARMLLPAADHGTDGLAARLDRLERRLDIQRPAHEGEHMSEQIIESSPEPSGSAVVSTVVGQTPEVETSPDVEPSPEVPPQDESAPGAPQEPVDHEPVDAEERDEDDQASSVAASVEPATDEEPPHDTPEAEPARDQSPHEVHAAG